MRRIVLGSLVMVTLGLLAAAPTAAQVFPRSGDLKADLMAITIPDEESNLFTAPSATDRMDWQQVIASLLAGNITLAAAQATTQNYDLWEYEDTVTNRTYYVFVENIGAGQNPVRGLGTYVYNPSWRRALNIQAPHARLDNDDSHTLEESIDMFLQLEATFLQIAGTHSNASTATSTCQTGYLAADVAHNIDNFFQETSNVVTDTFPTLVSVSVHGFGVGLDNQSPPAPLQLLESNSIAVISNGTCSNPFAMGCPGGDYPNSIGIQLATEINAILFGPSVMFTGAGAGSINWTPSDPIDTQPMGEITPSGNDNVQGRYINGATSDPCATFIADVSGPERFIHLEQQRALRHPPGEETIPGISHKIVIDAIGELFPVTPGLSLGAGSSLDLGTGELNLGCGDLQVDGSFLVSAGVGRGIRHVSTGSTGVLDGGGGLLELSGDWSRAGSFNPGTGTVSFVDGCGTAFSVISNSNTFANLSMSTATSKLHLFEAGSTQVIAQQLDLIGAPGFPLLLLSTQSGIEAFTNLLGGQFVQSVDVRDNFAIGDPIFLDADSVNSGNAPGWLLASAVPGLPLAGGIILTLGLLWSGRRRLDRMDEDS